MPADIIDLKKWRDGVYRREAEPVEQVAEPTAFEREQAAKLNEIVTPMITDAHVFRVTEHLPGVDAGRRRNPGASGGDHTSPERAVDPMNPGAPASMRRMLRLKCDACQHEWNAPALGSCPCCHARQVKALTQAECLLPRV